MALSASSRRRLGDLLVTAGLISDVQLKAALNEQKKWGGRLGRTVVELGFTTEETMVKVLASQLSLPSIDLDTATLPESIVEYLRLDLAEHYGVFPLRVDVANQSLSIATSDPTNGEALRALALATNLLITPTVASASSIDRAIRRYYFGEVPSGITPAIVIDTRAASPAPSDQSRGVDTTYQLDQLLGTETHRPTPNEVELTLRRELSALRQKVDSLEAINTSQVRAMRALLELLIESGLIARDEYLQKLHRHE